MLDFHFTAHSDWESVIAFFNEPHHFSEIARYTNENKSSESMPIYSSENRMIISSFLQLNSAYRGFKLRFTSDEPTICIGNLNENEGVFETPENQTIFVCSYQRDTQSAIGTLSIQIVQEPKFSTLTQCIPDLDSGISVYPDGDDDDYAEETIEFYTKCPPIYSPIITSNLRTIIRLKENAYYKYRFPYKVHRCGGRIAGQTITIPTFNSNYGALDCAWQYKASSSDQNIKFLVNAPAMNCQTEYLNIYRGSDSKRPHAARICGDRPISNQSVEIYGEYAYIEYHTDSYGPAIAAQLKIDVIATNAICGGFFDAQNFLFRSPLNGTKYPANTECEWVLRANTGYHIGLTFVDRFMIEQSPSCVKDYLKVFDKINGEFHEIAKICGREFPSHLNSTGQDMKLLFHTDETGNGDGFTVQWSENCGGVFRASAKLQSITSPNYPNRYPPNAYCNYTILPPLDQELQPFINVKFLTLNLELDQENCKDDNVTIYRQNTFRRRMRPIGTYCKNDSALTFRHRYYGLIE